MAEVLYSATIPEQYAIERARTVVLQCPVRRNGALVKPTSGTFTLRDPSDTAVINAQTTTQTNDIAEYSVTTLAAYAYADGWQAEWALTMPDSTVHTYRATAAVVKFAPQLAVSPAVLYQRMRSIDPSRRKRATSASATDHQGHIESAWVQIQDRLMDQGHRPWLIVNPPSLREPTMQLAFTLIFEDESVQKPSFAELATRHRGQYEAAWKKVSFAYDYGESGLANPNSRRGASRGTQWLVSRR